MPSIPAVAATKKTHTAMTAAHLQRKQESAWSTSTEIAYIDKMGTFRVGAPKPLPTAYRIELLRKYQAACLNRTDWGSMDRSAINTHINASLSKLIN